MISVRGEQYFDGVDPDATELMTEGTLEATDTGLLLRYRESELTGMEGTETTFEIGPRRVILRRSGSVSSQMVFEEGQQHTSLYETPYGELTVDIQMGSVEEVYRWVREDKADMGFASLQDGMTMDWLPLAEDPLLAILPPEYDLGGRERFDVRDFSGHEFLMPSMGFHLDILRALNRSGVTPVIRTTQVSDSVIISMVEHGLGVSVLSELVLKGRRDAVQAVPLDPPAFRELGIVTRDRRELRPAARRFITEARDIIRQIK